MSDMKLNSFLILSVLFANCKNIVNSQSEQTISQYTSVGTILSLENQGNAYFELIISTANSSKVTVWCVRKEISVDVKNAEAAQKELTQGVKVGVIGEWGNMEGEKVLLAKKIDIL